MSSSFAIRGRECTALETLEGSLWDDRERFFPVIMAASSKPSSYVMIKIKKKIEREFSIGQCRVVNLKGALLKPNL